MFIASLRFCFFPRLCVFNRPTFQLFSWHTCLLGIVSCLVMMFVINPVYSSGSIVLLLLLLLFLHFRSPTSSWGYISQALIFHQVSGLLQTTHLHTHTFIRHTVRQQCRVPFFFFFGLGAQVSVDAGCEERPREVLEAAGVADGGQSSLFLSAHPVCQPAEEGRAVCVGPRAAGRPG